MSEHISITTPDGPFRAYVARPNVRVAPAVVVLHEVFGVNSDIRQTCDELAGRGFVSIAPDLFWRQEPGVDLSVTAASDWDKGLALYAAYDRDLGVDDIVATVETAACLEYGSGKVAVLGYCLGGLMAYLTAARAAVDAMVAFHGADTEKFLDEADSLTSPTLMHLAGRDEFISGVAQTAINAALSRKPNVEIFTYPGCRHAFARHGGEHYDPDAAALANARTWDFLCKTLRPDVASAS